MTKTFETKDFYLSAYLIACGMDLLSHERRNGMTSFRFQSSETLTTLVTQFNGLTATVNPVQYGNAIRNLKTIIHSGDVLSNHNKSYVEQCTERA
jgi:hypothetical protein